MPPRPEPVRAPDYWRRRERAGQVCVGVGGERWGSKVVGGVETATYVSEPFNQHYKKMGSKVY